MKAQATHGSISIDYYWRPAEPWLCGAPRQGGWAGQSHGPTLVFGATMRIAQAYNRLKHSTLDQWRRSIV